MSHLQVTEILVIMSALLVAPGMIALLYAAFTGKLGRTESARFLPLRSPEKDFWQLQGRPEGRDES